MSSPPPIPTYPEALAAALRCVTAQPSVRIDLGDALGCVLREAICADRDQPPFDRAQMDGYAIRHEDLRVDTPIPVAGSIAAGEAATEALPTGACVAIATGAPLPMGADTVVQHELSDRAVPVRFAASACTSLPRGHAVHPRGADARAGDIVLDDGTRLDARHLAIAASVGATTPLVTPRPSVAILTSGDEIVDPASTPALQQVRNSNATLLRSLLPAMGARLGTVRHLADEVESTDDALRHALSTHALVITVGGISAGVRDRFVGAIDTLGLRTVVRRVRLQPGGPLTIALDERHGSVMLGLPGNPVSAMVCAHIFAWPLIRALGGHEPTLPWRESTLAAPARTRADRQAFRPASIDDDGRVTIPTWAGSGDLTHTARTQGIVELPMREGEAAAGTRVRYLRWCG